MDRVLPEAPYRQFVLTFPWPLRFPLAFDSALLSRMIRAYFQTLFSWMRTRGRALGIRNGRTGSVTFIQRFGGAINLNPHLHSLLPDGLFVPAPDPDRPLIFTPLPPPTDQQIETLIVKIARRTFPPIPAPFPLPFLPQPRQGARETLLTNPLGQFTL